MFGTKFSAIDGCVGGGADRRVTDIQPSPANLAAATVTTSGTRRQWKGPLPA